MTNFHCESLIIDFCICKAAKNKMIDYKAYFIFNEMAIVISMKDTKNGRFRKNTILKDDH